jgi:Niemann-Pick C1 protein
VVDFKEEKEQLELWVPRKSEYYKNGKWLAANIPSSKLRFSQALLTTEEDTILTGENIRKLFHIHDNINNVGYMGKLWKDICTKQPSPSTGTCERAENSLLEIWAKDGSYEETNTTIWTKTDKQIVDDINNINISGISNFPVNLNTYLGSISKINSRVEKAKALQMTFQSNLDQEGSNKSKALEFEQEFIYFLGNYSKENENGPVKVHLFNLKSMQDAIGGTIRGDLSLLSMGFVIVFIYVMVMLGKFNSVEQRAYLSLLGILAIGLGIATSYGICQLLGIWYGPMNSILPFMLLGIGIDDMFVIVQGLTNIQKDESNSRYI